MSTPRRSPPFPIQLTMTRARLQDKGKSKTLHFLDALIAKLDEAMFLMETQPKDGSRPRIVTANEAFEKIYGHKLPGVIGHNLQILSGAKTDPKILGEIYEAIKAQEAITRELFTYDKLGRQHWVEMEIFPVLDDQKISGYIAAVLRPIAGVAEQEESLRLNGERFSQAFEYGPLGMALVAPDGHWLTVNRRLCDLIGYTADELRHTTFQRLTHPEDLAMELVLADRTLKGETQYYHLEKRFMHKGGHAIWISLTVSLVRDRDGQPLYFIKQIENITESRQANEKIAQQAALLDKTHDAIVLCDMAGLIQFWNKGAEAIYGWSREEADGRQAREFTFKNNVAQFEQACRATLENGKWSNETPVIHKDGRELVVQSHWSLIRDQTDQPKAFLVISHDITDRKTIEEQLMRAQRMESIGTLAGGIAHDLNNILTPIMMSIEMLKATSSHPRALSIIDTIENISRRGADIVRQVLSFARGMKGDHVEVQPRHLLKDIQTLIKETLPKNIQLKYFFPHETWTIFGDPTQLHQILMNLCVNARDAMPNGGCLTIKAENAVIDAQYASMHMEAKPGKYVAISVSDTGTGIPPEVLDKIFEPFFTTKEVGKGTGLGLSTVIAIVKSHAGFLNVTTEVGKGTTFKVYVPAVEEASATEPEKEMTNLPRGQGETILLVDDEASILTITSQTLETFGYQVLTATDGAEAIALYAQHRDKIAGVLTDTAMPIMDGPTTMRVLRRMNPQVKIIAASGLKSEASGIHEADSEIKYFLDKPYTAGTLLRTLREMLDEG